MRGITHCSCPSPVQIHPPSLTTSPVYECACTEAPSSPGREPGTLTTRTAGCCHIYPGGMGDRQQPFPTPGPYQGSTQLHTTSTCSPPLSAASLAFFSFFFFFFSFLLSSSGGGVAGDGGVTASSLSLSDSRFLC